MQDEEILSQIQDDIARVEAMLDQAQAHYDSHVHLWDEETAWQLQKDIDEKRFKLGFNKILLASISAK